MVKYAHKGFNIVNRFPKMLSIHNINVPTIGTLPQYGNFAVIDKLQLKAEQISHIGI